MPYLHFNKSICRWFWNWFWQILHFWLIIYYITKRKCLCLLLHILMTNLNLILTDPSMILTDQFRKQCRILFTWMKNVLVFKVDFFGGGWWTCYVHYQQFIASPDLLAIHDNSGMWHFLQQFPKNNNLLNETYVNNIGGWCWWL